MRILSRNKKPIWYANSIRQIPVTDQHGLKTGGKRNIYGKPTRELFSIAISSGANNLGSQGMAELEQYGVVTGYTHRAVTENMDCPMNEESILWLSEPDPTWAEMTDEEWEQAQENGSVRPVYQFRVVRKAVSLNHLIFYLKEVDVG